MTSALVPVVSPPEPPLPQTLVCANCGAPLAGEYCAACGQRHEPHVHTLGHFAAEALESITHADSRLWRTLGYLLVKPGRLTYEFFAGRRARFLPPFRLYLVISLLFFLVAGTSRLVNVESSEPPTAGSVAKLEETARQMEIQMAGTPGATQAVAAVRAEAARQKAALGGTTEKPVNVQVRDSVNIGFCDVFKPVDPNASWNYHAMQAFCAKASHMKAHELVEAILHNIPRAMFVLLPLLALFMKLLYWRPKRYYVEHLLFLVHNHAFVFLAFAIMAVAMRIPVVGEHLALLQVAIWLYLFWYLFRAMRVYYGQSRLLSTGKYLVMGIAYISTSVLVLALTAIYSALTLLQD
jgi:Protein of unknown function (DUF3667)